MTDKYYTKDADDEKRFLDAVRELAHIGYGRMAQIVAYEWGERHPERAAMELRLTPKQFRIAKAADPLAQFWKH